MQLLVGRMMVMVPFSVLHARILTGDPLAAVLAGFYVYSSREVCICSIHVLRPESLESSITKYTVIGF